MKILRYTGIDDAGNPVDAELEEVACGSTSTYIDGPAKIGGKAGGENTTGHKEPRS